MSAMSRTAADLSFSGHCWERSYPAGQTWNVPVEAGSLTSILDRAVQLYGHRPAINCGTMSLSYAHIGDMAAKIARGLQGIGVGKGVKVGLFMPNAPYTVAFFYGILRAGGTVVNYNPLYAERELVSQVEDSETDIIITLDTEPLLAKCDRLLSLTRLKNVIVCPVSSFAPGLDKTVRFDHDGRYLSFDDVVNNDGRFEPAEVRPQEDIAVLQYTGGTTGLPKGAMLTHANLTANLMQTALWFRDAVTPGQDRQVCALPLFHVFAMTVVMNMSIFYGLEIVIVPRFEPGAFINILKDKKPQFVPGVPAMFNAILHHPSAEGLDLSFIKFSLCGGAPLPADVGRAYREKFGYSLTEGYGLTETSPVATCGAVKGEGRPGSVGLPIPGTLVEIVSMEDGRTILPPGVKGEVCISGAQVMKGYYRKPDETRDAIRNGRLHTGDVGYLDKDGYLYLVDRLKDVVFVNGYNVYPRNVEEAIYLHSAVEECIVAGVKDDKRGEAVWTWIKLREGHTLSDAALRGFLRDKLSPQEIPRKFFFWQKPLPKTAVGKLSKRLLLEQEGLV